jgi:hypothetical protein
MSGGSESVKKRILIDLFGLAGSGAEFVVRNEMRAKEEVAHVFMRISVFEKKTGGVVVWEISGGRWREVGK